MAHKKKNTVKFIIKIVIKLILLFITILKLKQKEDAVQINQRAEYHLI